MENKLDGNAAAGTLQEIFPFEMTLAQVTCTGCGTTNVIGATAAYMHGDDRALPRLRYRAHPRCACQGTLLAGYAGRACPRDQRGGLDFLLGFSAWW